MFPSQALHLYLFSDTFKYTCSLTKHFSTLLSADGATLVVTMFVTGITNVVVCAALMAVVLIGGVVVVVFENNIDAFWQVVFCSKFGSSPALFTVLYSQGLHLYLFSDTFKYTCSLV